MHTCVHLGLRSCGVLGYSFMHLFQVLKYDYCLGNQNPFKCEMFYTKEEPDKCIQLQQDQV